MGFFNRDGTKSLTGSFCGALWEVDGLTSGGRSGRESLESLNDSKSAKFFYKKIFCLKNYNRTIYCANSSVIIFSGLITGENILRK